MVALDELWSVSDSSGDQVSLMDTIEDPGAPDPAKALDVGDLKDRIAESIAKLPEREKLVIALYYYENLTLREIGEVLGVTESRVSQLHTKAVLRLRSRMQEDSFDELERRAASPRRRVYELATSSASVHTPYGPMATRTIVTSQPDVACDVCERRLLRGEQPDVFLAGGQRRTVCELCAPRAAHEGWLREADRHSVSLPPARARRGRNLFERLRQHARAACQRRCSRRTYRRGDRSPATERGRTENGSPMTSWTAIAEPAAASDVGTVALMGDGGAARR